MGPTVGPADSEQRAAHDAVGVPVDEVVAGVGAVDGEAWLGLRLELAHPSLNPNPNPYPYPYPYPNPHPHPYPNHARVAATETF